MHVQNENVTALAQRDYKLRGGINFLHIVLLLTVYEWTATEHMLILAQNTTRANEKNR